MIVKKYFSKVNLDHDGVFFKKGTELDQGVIDQIGDAIETLLAKDLVEIVDVEIGDAENNSSDSVALEEPSQVKFKGKKKK